ncbi:MAG: phosphatidate cytidylyltransferase [Candidatus Omnitrophica bacterium]|nr:phosphatidate cytidylyltransferase [Candidatus Omnitrophota bacterium]MBU4345991.1 phosphatidate cytidylyltransferase [Candidatus Omnitrophota bacterium]MBU4472827.1 phosphatidate cytidylyltransferase [Candidatus Omnitrophota bacterium]MCG2706020.1 phosphatidate cytidylyltransferase [Candidatus Omnitrophota bacterium]
MLTKRIFSSVILISLIIASVFIKWVIGLVITVFIIVGLYEFFTMLEKKEIKIYKYFGMGMGVIIPLSILFRFKVTQIWELLFIVLALLFLVLMQFRRRQNYGVVVDISTTIFGIIYVSWFLSFLIKIRYLPGGLGLFAMVLIVTKLGDIGAYLVGTCFGRKPLIPHISPKKSVEGAIGGLIFSVLGALASRPFLDLSYCTLIFIGIFLGILGQLGDLSESLIKRDCQVKDSGNLIPGMGGVLDLVDSLLFTAPTFYFYISTILR